jgi:hypothetical protein
MSVSHHIGLEIAERAFRFVEIQRQDRHTTILRADVLGTAHDYSSPLLFDLPYQRDTARDFIRDLAEIFLRNPVYAGSLSIVLPSVLPLVTMLPVDDRLVSEQRQRILEWDCETLGGHPPGSRLSILTHSLDRARKTLAVALPEACVKFLHGACDHLTLELSAIDTDHFVMENAMRLLYPHESDGGFGVLGLFADHCSAGMYSAGDYLGFRQTSVTYKQHYAAQAVHLLESIPGYHSARQPQRIFVFGPAVTDEVIDALNHVLDGSVARFVPLANTAVPDPILRIMREGDEHLFDVSASAALLGVS